VAATLKDNQIIEAQGSFLAEIRDLLKDMETKWISDAKAKRGVDGTAALQFLHAQVSGYKH